MTRRLSRSVLVALAAFAVATASSAVAATPGSGVPAPVVTGSVCPAPGSATALARITRGAGERSYSPTQLRRIDRQLQRRVPVSSARRAARRFGLVLRIPVRAHVIADRNNSGASEQQVLAQIRVMNDAYAGAQSVDGAQTRFTFYLASYDRVVNRRWRTASIADSAAATYRRSLHVGGAADLNLYVAAPASAEQGTVLGWSTPPWRVNRNPRVDGVTIHEASMPGGALPYYNQGDTVVHEVGHWLGLLHTFEGGCSPEGDLVDDTPAELDPSNGCDTTKDTCTADGLDPVHNFMDYSPDACMDMFTPGQVSRMIANWLAYRTP